MKFIPLLPIIAASLLPSCVTYDPDYAREAAQIQNVEYPANTIVGTWMQVGYRSVGDFLCENRVYDQFNSDGTGRSLYVKMIPPVYNEYKDLFNGRKDFSGEQILETHFTWRYLGKNKWEEVHDGNIRVISDPSWMKTTITGNRTAKSISRYHNGKLFYPESHSTAVSMRNEAAVKAKLATIRALKESQIRTSLESDRALLKYQKSLQKSGYSQPQQWAPAVDQGYNPGYGDTQYFQ